MALMNKAAKYGKQKSLNFDIFDDIFTRRDGQNLLPLYCFLD